MKKHELAKLLLEQDDGEISVSIDVSDLLNEITYGQRAFGTVCDYQMEGNEITLLCEGETNY